MLKIKGSVIRSLDNQPIDRATIKIHIDDLILTTDATDGEFEYSFSTSPTIRSGQHDILIEVKDEFGNIGTDSEKIFIEAIPSSLDIHLEKNVYLPSETIRITPTLLDQAKDPISKKVEIKIYNPRGKKVFNQDSETSKTIDFSLDKESLPGQWIIKAKSEGINSETIFEIKIIEEIQITLNNNFLTIENIGNIRYEKPLDILITTEEEQRVIKKRTNIDPGDFFEIDLNKEIGEEGIHNIKIINPEQEFTITIDQGRSFVQKVIDDLSSLTGQAVGKPGTAPSNTPTYTFLLLILVMILVLAYRFKLAKKRTKLPQPQSKKPKRFKFFKKLTLKRKERREIKDLKERILKNPETQQKPTENRMPDHLIPPKEEPKPRRISFDEPFKFK